jgi:hypothetical protein
LTGPAAQVLDWFARAGAAREDALTAFRQVLALHRHFGGLRGELARGEHDLASDMTDEQWERFRALKAEEEAHEPFSAGLDTFDEASRRKPEG